MEDDIVVITEEKKKLVQEYADKAGICFEVALDRITNLEKQMLEREEKINSTGTTEYLDWLYNFVEENKIYDDETALYEMEDGIDKENLLKISYLQTLVDMKARVQNVENILDEDNEFQILNYVFRYKDRLYQIDTMTGQGAVTFICLTDNKENRKIVEMF